MRVDLIIKDIQDQYAKENFNRLVRFVGEQQILDGSWKFFEVDIPSTSSNFVFTHNMGFIPKDIVMLNSIGNQNFRLKYDEFTATNLVIEAGGPVILRFLAGRYPSYASNTKKYPYIPISSGTSSVDQQINFCDIGAFMASTWDALLSEGLEIYTDQNGFSLLYFGSMYPQECNVEFLDSLVEQNQQYLFNHEGFVLR